MVADAISVKYLIADRLNIAIGVARKKNKSCFRSLTLRMHCIPGHIVFPGYLILLNKIENKFIYLFRFFVMEPMGGIGHKQQAAIAAFIYAGLGQFCF